MSLLRRLRAPSLESLFIGAFVLLGFRIGVLPIGDNSMFTHLRTGIDMVGGAGVPRSDPYSFTAKGTTWVAQSWLPEWTYGVLHKLGGFKLVVLEQAVLLAVLALLVARLARTGSPLRTAFSAGLAVSLGAVYWSRRPLLFGLICMALTVIIVERRRNPWLLVPVVWLWVNSHGSFPLGLVWLGARGFGEWIDWKDWPRETVRYIWAFVVGLIIAAIPFGARLLLFPLRLGEKRTAFENILEWQSPNFHLASNRLALVALAFVAVLMFRARLTWRDAVPGVVFLVISLYAVRNLPLMAIAIAPVLARILKRPDSAAPRPAATESQLRLNRVVAIGLVLMFVLFGLSVAAGNPIDVSSYPVAAVNWLHDNDLLSPAHRVAEQDFVGNYLTYRFGRKAAVFIDDRVDMYPAKVSADYVRLLKGRPDSLEILDRYNVDTVLWDVNLALSGILHLSAHWQEVYEHGDWAIYRRVP